MSWVWTHPQEPKGASLSWPNLLLQVETDLLQWQGLWSAAKAPTDVSMGKSPMRIHDKYWIASPLRSHNEAVYHGAQGEMINGDLGNLELQHWVLQVYELKALTSLQIQARRKCEIALLFGPLLCHLPAPLQLNPISDGSKLQMLVGKFLSEQCSSLHPSFISAPALLNEEQKYRNAFSNDVASLFLFLLCSQK